MNRVARLSALAAVFVLGACGDQDQPFSPDLASPAFNHVPGGTSEIHETYVSNAKKNENHGAESTLEVWASGKKHALVEASTDLVADLGAALATNGGRVFLDLPILATHPSLGNGGKDIVARLVTQHWEELGATYNCANDTNTNNNKKDCAAGDQWDWKNNPPVSANSSGQVTVVRNQTGTVSIDVTIDVEAFASGAPNFGWALRIEGGNSGRVTFGPPNLRFDPCEEGEPSACVGASSGAPIPDTVIGDGNGNPIAGLTSNNQPIAASVPEFTLKVEVDGAAQGGPCVDLDYAADMAQCIKITAFDPDGNEIPTVEFFETGGASLPVVSVCPRFDLPIDNGTFLSEDDAIANYLRLNFVEDDGKMGVLEPAAEGALSAADCEVFHVAAEPSGFFGTLARGILKPVLAQLAPKRAYAFTRASTHGTLKGLTSFWWSTNQVHYGSLSATTDEGWKHLIQAVGATPPAGWETSDLGWASAMLPAGQSHACGVPYTLSQTTWNVNTEILLNRMIPSNGDPDDATHPGDATVLILAAIDNDIRVFVNGIDVTDQLTILGTNTASSLDVDGFQRHEGCAQLDDFIFGAHPDDIGWVIGGDNTVAVHGRDRGVVGVIDVRVSVVEEELTDILSGVPE